MEMPVPAEGKKKEKPRLREVPCLMVPWTNICPGCRLRTQKWKSKDGAERERTVPTAPN